ncbi:MAG TPA: hypothetical protein VLB84_01755 [Bacteroidia bacterium]|nr:hypothetical protein [Bacteroidia bacterium]
MGLISKYNKTIRVGIHVIIWIVLFVFPVFFRGPNEKINYPWLIVHAWVPLVEYMIVFYANYISLTNKLLFKKKYLSYMVVNVLLIIIFLWINGKCHGALMEIDLKKGTLPDFKKFPPPPIITFILADLISFFVPIAFAVAMSSTEHWLKTESEKKEVENKNLEPEMV